MSEPATTMCNLGSRELAEIAKGRARAYFFLATGFNELPTLELLTKFNAAGPYLEALAYGQASGERAAQVIKSVLGGDRDQEIVTQVAVERTRLLRGVKPGYGLPPACEGVYAVSPGKVPDWNRSPDCCMLLKNVYLAQGYWPDNQLAPDYIGNELAFLGHCASREARQWDEGKLDEVGGTVSCESSFIQEHLLPWMGTLETEVQKGARHPFWPAWLTLTHDFLKGEAGYLSELLSDILN